MKRFETVPLGDVAAFSNGANFTKADFGDGLKIVGVSDFKDRLVPDWSSLDEVNETAITSERQLLQKGDVVFVRSNGNRRLVGRSMFIDSEERATHSAFTIRARPEHDAVAPRFLAYAVRSLHLSLIHI